MKNLNEWSLVAFVFAVASIIVTAKTAEARDRSGHYQSQNDPCFAMPGDTYYDAEERAGLQCQLSRAREAQRLQDLHDEALRREETVKARVWPSIARYLRANHLGPNAISTIDYGGDGATARIGNVICEFAPNARPECVRVARGDE